MTVKPEWQLAFDLMLSDQQAERAVEGDDQVLNVVRGSMLVRTVMLLEAAGQNGGSLEQIALREMRNAIVHNGFDVGRNRNSSALSVVTQYHRDLCDGQILLRNGQSQEEFFSLDGSSIVFDKPGISEACRLTLHKYI